MVTFKRGVYSSALRHLAPFARQIAGLQAIPQSRTEAWSRMSARPRHGQRGGTGNGSGPQGGASDRGQG